jgi:transcriptional regulator of met regulon
MIKSTEFFNIDNLDDMSRDELVYLYRFLEEDNIEKKFTLGIIRGILARRDDAFKNMVDYMKKITEKKPLKPIEVIKDGRIVLKELRDALDVGVLCPACRKGAIRFVPDPSRNDVLLDRRYEPVFYRDRLECCECKQEVMITFDTEPFRVVNVQKFNANTGKVG